jgi:hypothetical protein
MAEFTASAGTWPDPKPGRLKLAWQAMFLQEEAYAPVLAAAKPSKRGQGILMTILLVVAISNGIGMFFDLFTLPQIDLVENAIYQAIIESLFFQNWAAASPGFVTIFNLIYSITWWIVRYVLGYPSWIGLIVMFFGVLLGGWLDWYGYTLLAHMVARLLGGKGDSMQFRGAMALSYTPVLLGVANFIPGLTIPSLLIRLWMMATAYQAIKMTHNLSWGRSVIVIIAPYFLASILLGWVVRLGIFFGVTVAGWLS